MPHQTAQLIHEFLALPRIAVAGVSRGGASPGNTIFRKLKDAGHEVYAVNPAAASVEGERCYPDLRSISPPPDGVVIATAPHATEQIVRECAELGIGRVWMHQSIIEPGSSISPEAVAFCHEHGISAIVGGCPMMFCEPVDFGHACMRWMMRVGGKLPR